MYRIFILLLISSITLSVEASDKKEIGFKLNVTVKGFFSPEVTSATVKSVTPGSLAESLGVKAGEKLIAIANCKIPGCPAGKAKGYISQDIGTEVSFEFSSQAGKTYSVTIPLQ